MTNNLNIKPLRAAFIGGSINSAVGYAHFVSSTMDNLWVVDAGCFSLNTERNHKTAEAYGVEPGRVYDNWREMLKKEKDRLDAVIILTPTQSHYEMVIETLEAGFPVICEKALGTTSSEAEQILKTRDRTNGFLAVIYNYSAYPMVRELQNLIKKGILGDIIHFQAEMPQEGYLRIDASGNKIIPQTWRLHDGFVPTIHLDLAVHLHELIYYLTGQRPIETISDQNSFGWFPEVIDNVTCLSRYTNGIHGQYWFSKSAIGHRNGLRLRIYGRKASAEWYQATPEELIVSYSDGRKEILERGAALEVVNLHRYNRFKSGHPAGFIEAFANLYYDIADALHQYRESGTWKSEQVFSAELAIEGLKFFEAMIDSCKSKKWERVK
ncbi:MAG: Gfo/Idh/MocA family oxidoreductase [Ignavibacteriaceae bacterium]|nr:Gfo/Idh/MocA family oxidoreductase [Ignavibacteriaceae bacterium]